MKHRTTVTLAGLLAMAQGLSGCAQSYPAMLLDIPSTSRIGNYPRTIRGISISSTHADPSSTYLAERDIDLLRQLNALNDTQYAVASRVDGIIANRPRDGKIDIDELVRQEVPEFFSTLYPDEQIALGELWQWMETIAPLPVELEDTDFPILSVEEDVDPVISIAPDAVVIADVPDFLDIAYAEIVSAVNRLQLSYDHDNDTSTVSLDDLDLALANPGPYLHEEIAVFDVMRDYILSLSSHTGEARVVLTAPGKEEYRVELAPGVAWVNRYQRIEYVKAPELRCELQNPSPGSFIGYRVKGAIFWTEPGQTVLIIRHQERRLLSDDGRRIDTSDLRAGETLLEIWDVANGQRVDSIAVTLPESEFESMDLGRYFGFILDSDQGELNPGSLRRQPKLIDKDGVVYPLESVTYKAGAADVMASNFLSQFIPERGLAPGSYSIGQSSLVMDVYPDQELVGFQTSSDYYWASPWATHCGGDELGWRVKDSGQPPINIAYRPTLEKDNVHDYRRNRNIDVSISNLIVE